MCEFCRTSEIQLFIGGVGICSYCHSVSLRMRKGIRAERKEKRRLKKQRVRIKDLIEMPGTDPSKVGERGMYSVSQGKVTWDAKQKAVCHKHGAMNSVAESRKIWRCLAFGCGEACYVER